MESNNKTQKSSTKDHYKFFYDEVTKRKIERHLSDINDTISDEDIMNVITNITSGNSNEQNDLKADSSFQNNSVLPDDQAKQIPTSWNIID